MKKLLDSDKPSLELMLRFVSKSNLCSTFDCFLQNNEEVTAIEYMHEAIKSGDWNHPIFLSPNAELYILHLMKSEAISLNEGWTTLIYLMALLQFSSLDESCVDKDIKILSSKTIQMLSFNDNSAPEVITYIERLAARKLKYPFDSSAFRRQIANLNTSEQLLIKVPLSAENVTKKQYDDIIRFIKLNLVNNVPIVQLYEDYFLIPSFSVITIYFKLINPGLEILPAPIYGSISAETLLDFHQHKLHPIAFYSTKVKSNLHLVHGRRSGPIPALLHDFLHVFMALQLSKNQYDLVFSYLIPLLQEIAIQFKRNDDLVKKCTEIISELCDLDLTFYGDFKHFEHYVRSSFNLYPAGKNEFADIDGCLGDNLYYLLLQRFKRDTALIQEKYNYNYRETRLLVTNIGIFYREREIVYKIWKLAELHTSPSLSEALQENIKVKNDRQRLEFNTRKEHENKRSDKEQYKFIPGLFFSDIFVGDGQLPIFDTNEERENELAKIQEPKFLSGFSFFAPLPEDSQSFEPNTEKECGNFY